MSNVKKERRKGAGPAAPEKAGPAQETREARVVAVLYTCTAARITTFVFFAVGMLRESGRAFWRWVALGSAGTWWLAVALAWRKAARLRRARGEEDRTSGSGRERPHLRRPR